MDNMVMARDIDAIASPSSTFTLVMSFFICASLFFRGLQSALRTTPAMRIAEMSIVAPMTARVTVSVSFKHTQAIAIKMSTACEMYVSYSRESEQNAITTYAQRKKAVGMLRRMANCSKPSLVDARGMR